jgi:hypothetical protein
MPSSNKRIVERVGLFEESPRAMSRSPLGAEVTYARPISLEMLLRSKTPESGIPVKLSHKAAAIKATIPTIPPSDIVRDRRIARVRWQRLRIRAAPVTDSKFDFLTSSWD